MWLLWFLVVDVDVDDGLFVSGWLCVCTSVSVYDDKEGGSHSIHHYYTVPCFSRHDFSDMPGTAKCTEEHNVQHVAGFVSLTPKA